MLRPDRKEFDRLAQSATLVPVVQTVIADASTPRERGRYQALIGTVWVSAGISGPLVGR